MKYTFDESVKHFFEDYVPKSEYEDADRTQILTFCSKNRDAYERSNTIAHITASAWAVNSERTHALMIYHNIYKSWSWTGGHADGDTDLLAVAMRELEEETGVKCIPVSESPVSVETGTVENHIKRGKVVSSHLHLNATFLLIADINTELRIKPDENSGVKWIPFEEVKNACTENEMQPIYAKLIERSKLIY